MSRHCPACCLLDAADCLSGSLTRLLSPPPLPPPTLQNERVLFHYNGHGVPRPTANGEVRAAGNAAQHVAQQAGVAAARGHSGQGQCSTWAQRAAGRGSSGSSVGQVAVARLIAAQLGPSASHLPWPPPGCCAGLGLQREVLLPQPACDLPPPPPPAPPRTCPADLGLQQELHAVHPPLNLRPPGAQCLVGRGGCSGVLCFCCCR